MPSLGPLEIVMVAVVALLVFGPDKLPDIGKQIGRAMREFRRVQSQLEDEVRGSFLTEGVSPSSTPEGATNVGAPAVETETTATFPVPMAPLPDNDADRGQSDPSAPPHPPTNVHIQPGAVPPPIPEVEPPRRSGPDTDPFPPV